MYALIDGGWTCPACLPHTIARKIVGTMQP